MADVTRTIYIRVLAFDPAEGRDLPVPGAKVLCENREWLWDPDLSSGNDTTGADGRASVAITFDEAKEGSLNPFFTITVPDTARKIPAGAPADATLSLPGEWTTRHYVNHRLARISDHTNPDNPIDLHVGLHASLHVAWTDFHPSGIRDPLALPHDTVRIYLADYDIFIFDWLDWLNPDDTLTGMLYDPRQSKLVPAGPGDRYVYFDAPPTTPFALADAPAAGAPPRAWVDPPGAPVGQLGGGSFDQVGPIAADGHGFVFMLDGQQVRRLYPDGTHCETVAITPSDPRAIALDQYRHLYVAGTHQGTDGVWPVGHDLTNAGALGERSYGIVAGLPYQPHGPNQIGHASAVAVIPTRAVDEPEILAVADSASGNVQLLRIDLSPSRKQSVRMTLSPTAVLTRLATVPIPPAAGVAASEPVALAAGPDGALYVADRASHRVSRWRVDAQGNASHEADWGTAGGGPGSAAGEFDTPLAIALDRKNNFLYVGEAGNGRVQRLDAAAGSLANWTPVYGAPAAFAPGSLAADPRGELYVTDTANTRVVRATSFDAAGAPHAVGDPPDIVGTPWSAAADPSHMKNPEYVALGRDGKLWVADTGNNRVQAFARDQAGELEPAPALSSGPVLGSPRGIAEDADGNVFVVDAGNHCVRRYDPSGAHVADIGAGTPGSGPNQFRGARGIAVAQRTEPVLYVADPGNDRIQRAGRDGTFIAPLSKIGSTQLSAPFDVAVDDQGRVFIADTGNARVVELDASDGFVREIKVPAPASTLYPPPPTMQEPTGVAIDPEGKLLVTDRKSLAVLRVERDGTLLAWWDLKSLLAQWVKPKETFYYTDLARQIPLSAPVRAVMDGQRLLSVADSGNHRVRLVRSATNIDAELFDLGEALPDISFRAITKADWQQELGLRLNVGDVDPSDDSHDFVTEPVSDFADDVYECSQLLGAIDSTNAAINVMRVVRTAQLWYQAHTRTADDDRRWGKPGADSKVNVDLYRRAALVDWAGDISFTFLDVNFGLNSNAGRGADAWDDSVVAHEFSHKVFYSNVLPTIPFSGIGWLRVSGEHNLDKTYNQNTAMSEGFAEYVELFWGAEGGPIDRVRGNALNMLSTIGDKATAGSSLFGGPASASSLPTFDAAGRALRSEGYLSNAIYQIHRALISPEVLFADSPSYWYGFDGQVTTHQADRFDALIWKPLSMWPTSPTVEEWDHASELYVKNVLRQARALGAGSGEVAHSILELNNLLSPSLSVTVGTSTTVPGSALPDTVELAELQTVSLIVQLLDATGAALQGHNIVCAKADPAHYGFEPAVGGPDLRHGRLSTTAGETNRATNASGIVNITYTAPAVGPPGTPPLVEELEVSYQPDFDKDASFSPPERGDDHDTTLSRAYLYELRAANKTWRDVGKNLGVRLSVKVRIKVTAG